jgi:hypothetical protein
VWKKFGLGLGGGVAQSGDYSSTSAAILSLAELAELLDDGRSYAEANARLMARHQSLLAELVAFSGKQCLFKSACRNGLQLQSFDDFLQDFFHCFS